MNLFNDLWNLIATDDRILVALGFEPQMTPTNDEIVNAMRRAVQSRPPFSRFMANVYHTAVTGSCRAECRPINSIHEAWSLIAVNMAGVFEVVRSLSTGRGAADHREVLRDILKMIAALAIRAHRDLTMAAPGDPPSSLYPVCCQVVDELKRASEKHAPMASPAEGYAVLLEEIDELWAECLKQKDQRDMDNVGKELIQIAAMAARMWQDVGEKGAAS